MRGGMLSAPNHGAPCFESLPPARAPTFAKIRMCFAFDVDMSQCLRTGPPAKCFALGKMLVKVSWALVQIGPANGLELSEENEPRSRDEQAEESGEVVRRTPF